MIDPVAFHLGPLAVRWYGILAASGFMAAYGLLQHRALKSTLGRERSADLAFLAMLGGVVGARLLYVLQNWAYFRRHMLEIPRVDHGGLVFYGGFIGASLLIVLVCRLRGWRIAEVADLVAPALPLGHALGRIGCLLNGCCFGRPASGWLSLLYPAGGEVMAVQKAQGLLPATAQTCLFVTPVQLYSSLMNFGLCGMLLLLEKRVKKPGLLFLMYVAGHASGRFLLEFMRGDYTRRIWWMTPAQVICLGLLVVALGLIAVLKRRAEAVGVKVR
jgi:phosphatidylglycerol:prolipoprotein diacylglycerol transferase